MHADQRARQTARRSAAAAAPYAGRAASFVATVLILSPMAARAEIIERLLAVVQGVVITQSDATAAADLGLVPTGPTADPLGAVLAKLIDRQIVLSEVERYAPAEPSVEDIDRRLHVVQARFGSADEYTAALNRSGLDQARLRQRLRDELRIEAYLAQRFPAERRADLIAEWVNGLRRRADIIYLYVPRR